MSQGFANTTRESILHGWSLIVEPGTLALYCNLTTATRFLIEKQNYLALARVKSRL